MRNPYWRTATRGPFSLVLWAVFGFNIATSAISLAVPAVPLLFTFIALGLLVAVVIVWWTLAIRDQRTGSRQR